MKKYSDFSSSGSREELSSDEIANINWTKYKIIVPTEEDKQEIMSAMQTFHDEGYDPELITCNQMAHEYVEGHNIIVDKELFEKMNQPKDGDVR